MRFAVALACLCLGLPAMLAVEPPPVRILIGANKAVTLTVPAIDRDNLISIAATFLGRENKDAAAKLNNILTTSGGEITLVLTSRRTP